jgi:mRNA interferase HigB
MKVHLLKERTIRNYVLKNSSAAPGFQSWLNNLSEANWQTVNDIKKTFNSADVLQGDAQRVCFDISGNNYRIICKYLFGNKDVKLFVAWIGTHAEYDKLKKGKKHLTAENYKDYE